MEISMTIKKDSFDNSSAMDGLPIQVTGIVTAMYFQDDGLSKQLEKAEMLDNIVSMGLINEETLEGIGYYKKGWNQ